MIKRHSIITTIEVITPEAAAEYLATRDTKNRPISPIYVQRYAAAMSRGAWKLVHQGVAFDVEGRLFDGQHRMSAIVKAGVPVEMMVFRYKQADEAKLVIDDGKARTLAERLVFEDIADRSEAKDLGSMVTAFSLLRSGWSKMNGKVGVDMVQRALDTEPDLGIARRCPAKMFGAMGRGAVAFMRRIDPDAIDLLVEDLQSEAPSFPVSRAILRGLADQSLRPGQGANKQRFIIAVQWCRLIEAHIVGKDPSAIPPYSDGEADRIRQRRALIK